ncbi:NAD-dependent epimerase/dehydratase family protein [Desulfatirhabdium butyrativorans]|uniref:NAD-dependent epimerase/dehydratase family protein n=1 Tax=Desulfatirhabdium butyrativorans TaxID=340467 RepID=UPI0004159999|nr:NAD-dependent epimerase/dehydratase family protein [Desulfatirhabdium butyrativorans]
MENRTYFDLPINELEEIGNRIDDRFWKELQNSRIFVTGGTGFFGIWLLESLVWVNFLKKLDIEIVVLTRDVVSIQKKAPYLASFPCIHWHIGDIRGFDYPEGQFSHLIHLASASAFEKAVQEPLERYDTIVMGTRRTLDFAVHCNARKFLYVSSGNVYGRQPDTITHVPEDFSGCPDLDESNAALGFGKRAAEFLCCSYSQKFGIETKIARCFTFVGPYLQLNLHYAVGNFIRDALAGGPIVIKGDGSSLRSYLYAGDLAVWLWKILLCGASCRPYNVGSEYPVTILQLAQIVAQYLTNDINIEIQGNQENTQPINRYIPCTFRARSELALEQYTSLQESIRRTIRFYAESYES